MKKSSIKLIFFGTTEFAVPVLEALIKEGYDVVAVITEPDKLVGRNQILTPPPIKQKALSYKLKVLQPQKLRDNKDLYLRLKSYNLDLGIVVYYGKIIPKELIDLPRFGLLNIHPSLLPKYRGPSPVQTPILNGDKETGVTIMKVDEEMDHGPIMATHKLQITNSKKNLELLNELTTLGTDLLIKTLPDYLEGKVKLKPQEHDKATYTKKFKLEDGEIKLDDKVEDAYNKIRALNPEPGTYFVLPNNKKLKILGVILEVRLQGSFEVGLQIDDARGKPALVFKDGALILKKVQLEGKKPISGEDFLNGYSRYFK